jgi:hypothetical protein
MPEREQVFTTCVYTIHDVISEVWTSPLLIIDVWALDSSTIWY